MSSSPLISDDEDFVPAKTPEHKKVLTKTYYKPETVLISSDEDECDKPEDCLTSDEDELPSVQLRTIQTKKENIIKYLFPTKVLPKVEASTSFVNNTKPVLVSSQVHKRMIGGVQVDFPVPPYGAQIALMSKVIEGISKGLNCLLESPTGSGKTLALLCAALAWQKQEKNRINTVLAQQSVAEHPQLKNVPEPMEVDEPMDPVNLFSRTTFGEKSIYDKPGPSGDGSPSIKVKREDSEWNNDRGLVTIHAKKRKLDRLDDCATPSKLPSTPINTTPEKSAETPKSVRVPTIFYGARTHKQIQQVVKEFSRTVYCGDAKMTVLSSREYSCIREFDRNLYSSKNDMCRECVKNVKGKLSMEGTTSNCKFFENRQQLNHKSLPPAFDLEELVNAGQELRACPFYAARLMTASAQIIFCPYNYLIDPGIRSSMQINVQDEIVILDEAHNIEDICRDAATFTYTKEQVIGAIKELEHHTEYKYASSDIRENMVSILWTMKSWSDWFTNQTPLARNKPVNNNEAVYTWQVEHFVKTLDNHNIGYKHFPEFENNANLLINKFRDEPDRLFGITPPTINLIEGMLTVYGYLYRENCKHIDDFKPALILHLVTSEEAEGNPGNWRSTQFHKKVETETVSLRMMCMSPAVVFASLKPAKSIILSSGTLTPLISLHSELGTSFPLQISPNHVIPADRVWIGSLTTCPNGRPLECKSQSTNQTDVQDALGDSILWVSQVTPNGVLCFLPSYQLMNKLKNRWLATGLWRKLNDTKNVFMESRNVKDHNDVMEEYYNCVTTPKGALLFAVYRGKVSEGMDFKDHQARAVITVGIPYPNTFDMMVKEKMAYNERHVKDKQLLTGNEWLRVQAYRALNQAVGRCVRHRGDWGAVLLVDYRYTQPYYTEHLSKWVRNFLGNNHHSFQSLTANGNSFQTFMQRMTLEDTERDAL